MGTCARVAHGISDTLLTRAADVMIKEKRTLVVVPRETPLSVIHLENLTALARAGATILPAMPSFYAKPESPDQLLDTVVGRVLDHLGVEHALLKRWGAK
jgi:4-hydroxy-3-polyprenylbenzoate decarboxylase